MFKMTWYRFLSFLSANYMAITPLTSTARALHESQVFEINPIMGLVGNHNPRTNTALPGHSKGNNTAHKPCHFPAIPVGGGWGGVDANDWCISLNEHPKYFNSDG